MSGNTLGSDINEIHLAYLLNNNSYPDILSQKQIEKRIKAVSEETTMLQKGRAEAMYNTFLKFLSSKGYGSPVSAYWTSRPGFSFKRIVGIDVNQRLNPTDVLVGLSNGKFYGISAKSSRSSGVGFKNPGVGTIDKYLSTNLRSIAQKYVNQIIEEFDLPKFANGRKQVINADPNLKKQIMVEYGSPCLREMRESYLNTINQLGDTEIREFIATEWLNENPEILRLPYVKITGTGTNVYSASLYDPIGYSQTRHLVKGPITFSSVGNDSVGVTANSTKILKMRFKFESTQLASSAKMSGDPW